MYVYACTVHIWLYAFTVYACMYVYMCVYSVHVCLYVHSSRQCSVASLLLAAGGRSWTALPLPARCGLLYLLILTLSVRWGGGRERDKVSKRGMDVQGFSLSEAISSPLSGPHLYRGHLTWVLLSWGQMTKDLPFLASSSSSSQSFPLSSSDPRDAL